MAAKIIRPSRAFVSQEPVGIHRMSVELEIAIWGGHRQSESSPRLRKNDRVGLLHGEPVATAPWQVRRAEQFIEANWDQPTTIEALVAATNVSARSLFSSFKAGRGYSPMNFVNACVSGAPGRNCRG